MFDRHISYLMNGFCFDAPADKGAESSGGETEEAKTKKDAKSEYRDVVAELRDSVKNFKEGYLTESEFKAREEKINDRLDELDLKQSLSHRSQDQSEQKGIQHKATFEKAFWSFVKNERSEEKMKSIAKDVDTKSYHPSLATKSDNFVRFDFASSGALLMPAEMSQQIIYNAIETTPITQLVNATTTSRSQKKNNLRVSTPGVYWVEEEGVTPKDKIQYRQVTLTPKKAAARYGVSIENEQDSGYDLYGEMRMAYAEDFAQSIGKACLSGDGNGKPKGMIGSLERSESGGLTLTSKMLINLTEEIQEVYQRNSQFLFTRETRAFIRNLFLTSDGGALQYLWEPDFTKRSPTLLLGAPVNIAAIGDMAGNKDGTFTAGEVPVLYGDFRTAYEFTTHTDMFVIDDPYTESAQWIRNLNIMSRVDGQPMKTEAAAELIMTNS